MEVFPRHRHIKQPTRLLIKPGEDDRAGWRDRALIETLYSCGLRVGEAVALNWSDVDRDTGMVIVRQGKGDKDTPWATHTIGERPCAFFPCCLLDQFLAAAAKQAHQLRQVYRLR